MISSLNKEFHQVPRKQRQGFVAAGVAGGATNGASLIERRAVTVTDGHGELTTSYLPRQLGELV